MRYNLFSLLCAMLILACSCHTGSENSKPAPYSEYDTLKVDLALSRSPFFAFMDQKYQPITFSQMLANDTVRHKATSTVTIIELTDSRDWINTTDELACEATLSKDTLWITNGFSTGFSGAGVSIQVAGNTFRALPYEFYDVIIEGEKEPIVRIEKQKLTLDKATYQVGDSLFGHLYLRTLVLDTDTVRTYAHGYFRTKVKKQ